MTQEWIESLVSELKSHDYDKAERHNANKRRKRMIADDGPLFFGELVRVLQSNLHELLSALKGTPLEQPTTVYAAGDSLEISREAAPCILATLTREADGIVFGYHVDGPTGVEEKYFFDIDQDDSILVADPFGVDLHLDSPDEVAKRIMITLFSDR